MKLIYQIGRLERGAFNPIKFEINGNVYEAQLSSFALRNHFQNTGVPSKVVLIYPISLLLNKIVLNFEGISDELKDVIKQIVNKEKIEDYLRDPYPYFEKHPHSKTADDFLVIHSVGEYEGISFQATLEDLILEIFVDMVSRYQNEPFTELYLDISSGHNIYVSALLEAGRLFLTFYKLQNFCPDGEKLKAYITFSDPILPPYDRKFTIHKKFSLKVKAFFNYPRTPDNKIIEDGYSRFAKHLMGNDEELRKKRKILNELFSYGYFFYSAIKNNIPLILYTWEYHSEEKIDEGVSLLTTFIKEKLSANYQSTPKLDFNLFRDAFLMLALYRGTAKVLQNRGIYKKEEVSLNEIKNVFLAKENKEKNPYMCFELTHHIAYLSHEINNTFEKSSERGGVYELIPENYVLLRELIKGESEGINDRNFLAHCGFERNCIYVKKVNNEIFIKYDQTKLKAIESILMRA